MLIGVSRFTHIALRSQSSDLILITGSHLRLQSHKKMSWKSRKSFGSKSTGGDGGASSALADDKFKVDLGRNRFLTISNFKNQTKVDLREYYMTDDGERKPGKKGISLSLEEWKKIKESISEIDAAIKKEGGTISASSSDSES